jgi:xylulokinase
MRQHNESTMKRQLLLSIDIGTQSTRAALLTPDGQVVASAGRAQEMDTPHPGWAQQDPDMWWANAVSCISEIMAQASVSPDEIIAVGAGGQMHGTVPIDAHGKLLSHQVQLWCDKRGADLVDEFKRLHAAEESYRLSGSPPVPSWVGFKMKWLKLNAPEVYDRTWKILLPKDYVNFRLTGVAATDYSEASGFFLMDAAGRQWSDELVGLLGLDRDKLPDIRSATDVIGTVTESAATVTGLATGTPVVTGGADMMCMLLAAGLTEPGAASDITGTSGIFSVFTTSPVLDERLMNLHHVTDGWVPFGITDTGGVSLKWFKDNLCRHESEEADKAGVEVYDLLDEKAAQVLPGSEGLLFFPYLLGERTLGTPNARGVFFGLTPRHNVAMIARSIMEGVTFELRQTLEIVEKSGHEVSVVYHSGGGAYSDLWSQIKADIYQKPVVTFENTEGGLLGAAILAGSGAGLYPNEVEGAARCLRIKRTFEPNAALAKRYDYQFALFQELHGLLQGPFDRLAAMP